MHTYTTLGRLPLGDDWDVKLDGGGQAQLENRRTAQEFSVYRMADGFEVEHKHMGDDFTADKRRETWYPSHWDGVVELAGEVARQGVRG